MKNKLILRGEEYTSFHSHYLTFLWERYFDIEWYDQSKTYDQSGNVFVVNWQNANDDYSKQLKNQGYRVAVDNLWEFPTGRKNYHWIEHPDWFWYNESIWWRNLGYHRYHPNKTYSKRAFMQIGRSNQIRDEIVNQLDHRLDSFVWSYRDQNLPNDVSKSQDNYQRFFNPQWYDNTYFSLVVESMQGYSIRLTEKSFKPMAYKHPFLLIGPPGSLKKLQSLGFETYENLFDESYDNIVRLDQRLPAIIKNIDDFVPKEYDTITLEKMQHNHARFFNRELVESKIIAEIIEPLINYIET